MKEIITSRQNPLVKTVCSLSEKKHRRSMKLFRFDGVKLFEEAIFCGIGIEYVILSEKANLSCNSAVDKALEEGKLNEEKVVLVSEIAFEKISEEKAPEGIITVARELSTVAERVSGDRMGELVGEKDRILIAEALRDAGNLGTVIRSSAALGIDTLVLSDDCADLYNPKTIRAAMGGLFRLNIILLDKGEMPLAIKALRASGRCVYATALKEDSTEIGRLSLKRGDCFVIGNEGHGLSDEVIASCDAACIIPMKKGCESLNASAAAAICIWETVKN